MAISRQKKQQQVERLGAELKDSTSAIIGTFAKLTVSQDYELRKVVRGAGGKYRVLKNKLAARASQGSKVEEALQGLKGVSSVAYTSGDPVALAKALSTWVSDNAEFSFKLGIIDGKLISIEEVKQLATMPGKEELFSKLLFLMSSPAQRLATVIAATGRDLAVVINQAVEQNKFTPGPEAKPAVEAKPAPEAKTEAAPEIKQEAGAPEAKTEAAAAPATETKPEAVSEAAAEEASAESPAEGFVSAPAEGAEHTPPETQAEAASGETPVEGEVVK